VEKNVNANADAPIAKNVLVDQIAHADVDVKSK